MTARILDFPAPRILRFRRSGPLRWMAFLILLLISAGMIAVFLGSGTARHRSSDEATPQDPLTLGR